MFYFVKPSLESYYLFYFIGIEYIKKSMLNFFCIYFIMIIFFMS